jgi:glycosyltransferase involved in cell wall biosynthesis
MVGGDVNGIKALQKEARRLGVLEKVEFVPERPDINEYWAKADIHLLTSICESFCLVWAEAKAAGIPTVMFELPYLELAEDKRGFIAVEQRNIKALAGAIVKVVNDGGLRLSMGKDAKESLSPFNDEAVWQSWARVFEGVKEAEAGLDVDTNLKMIVSQMYMAVCYDKEVHRWPEEMADNWQRLTRTSMLPIARGLECLVDTGRKIKAKIRE